MIDPLDLWLCGAAQSAYSTPATFLAGGDVHAIVTDHDGLTVVSFRGTVPSSWHDWFRDFAAWPHTDVTHPQLGRCHEGFLSGALAMLPLLQPVLPVAMPYALTGHSLGGALAIAMAGLMQSLGNPPLRLTTFGAPRVGGAKLSNLLGPIRGLRFRHGDDPVPEVPEWPYVNDRDWAVIGTPGPVRIDDHMIAGYLAALNQS